MYVVIEGGDGSGKDTQADMLVSYLAEQGLDPLRVAEPCEGLPTGKFLRQLLASGDLKESHAALFLADRMALTTRHVKPALDAGRPVVSVRSFLSTLVYQQDHYPLDWLLDIHRQMSAVPDVVILLDIDPAVGLGRVGQRGVAAEVYETLDIQQRTRQRYMDLIHRDGPHHLKLADLIGKDALYMVLDASGSRERVHEWIRMAIEVRLRG